MYKAKFTELHLLTNFEIMQKGDGRVFFFFEVEAPGLRDRKRLKSFIISIFKNEKRQLTYINYIFSTDRSLHAINKKYLKHDYLTDIITFELSGKGQPVTAEVYISLERIRENAYKNSVSLKSELHRVIFHGVLHLCGYDDKTGLQRKKIRAREEYYLLKYLN